MTIDVTFDKESYAPGDIVKASILIQAPYPKRLKNIQLKLESGERVTVAYEDTDYDSDGDSYTTTMYDTATHIHKQEERSIKPDMDYVQEELHMELPNEVLLPINLADLDVYHKATIKFDVRLGKDTTHEFDIPYNYTHSPDKIKSVLFQEEGITAQINKNMVFHNDEIDIEFHIIDDVKFRSFRVEMRELIALRTDYHSTSWENKKTIYETDHIPTYFRAKIPKFELQTQKGNYHNIQYFIRFVIDKVRKRDINIDLPISYYN